ncbi:MAG: diacylglycerol kinase family protein [Chloroflexota bacterium]
MAKTALVILNPHAHSGQTPQQMDTIRDTLSTRLKDALALKSIEWCETEHPGQGKELARDAVKKGCNYIFAGGGDGTINEVLNGIMEASVKLSPEKRPVMGVLPFGTSNDFFAALKTAESARKLESPDALTLVLDVGHVMFDEVERYFCLTVGIGLFSWANEQYLEASSVYGRRFAHIPAAIKTLTSYRFLPNVKISRNGKQSRARRILSVVVDNSPVIAGGTPLTPKARIDNGQFDVCIIKPVSLLRLLWLVFQVSTKTHTRSQSVQLGRVREITITAKQPLPIHVDGELVPEIGSKARRMAVEIMPGALRIVIPSLCELPQAPAANLAAAS